MTPANRLLNGAINDKDYKEQSALLNAIGDSESEEAISKANSFIKQLIN